VTLVWKALALAFATLDSLVQTALIVSLVTTVRIVRGYVIATQSVAAVLKASLATALAFVVLAGKAFLVKIASLVGMEVKTETALSAAWTARVMVLAMMELTVPALVYVMLAGLEPLVTLRCVILHVPMVALVPMVNVSVCPVGMAPHASKRRVIQAVFMALATAAPVLATVASLEGPVTSPCEVPTKKSY
jgi:hypothetical protein